MYIYYVCTCTGKAPFIRARGACGTGASPRTRLHIIQCTCKRYYVHTYKVRCTMYYVPCRSMDVHCTYDVLCTCSTSYYVHVHIVRVELLCTSYLVRCTSYLVLFSTLYKVLCTLYMCILWTRASSTAYALVRCTR